MYIFMQDLLLQVEQMGLPSQQKWTSFVVYLWNDERINRPRGATQISIDHMPWGVPRISTTSFLNFKILLFSLLLSNEYIQEFFSLPSSSSVFLRNTALLWQQCYNFSFVIIMARVTFNFLGNILRKHI